MPLRLFLQKFSLRTRLVKDTTTTFLPFLGKEKKSEFLPLDRTLLRTHFPWKRWIFPQKVSYLLQYTLWKKFLAPIKLLDETFSMTQKKKEKKSIRWLASCFSEMFVIFSLQKWWRFSWTLSLGNGNVNTRFSFICVKLLLFVCTKMSRKVFQTNTLNLFRQEGVRYTRTVLCRISG